MFSLACACVVAVFLPPVQAKSFQMGHLHARGIPRGQLRADFKRGKRGMCKIIRAGQEG